MRIFTKLSLLSVVVAVAIFAGLRANQASYAETDSITIGPWTFEDTAFADDATVLDSVKQIRMVTVDNCSGTEENLGTQRFEECIDLALTDYSPETFLVNTGSTGTGDTGSNWFQLEFTDLKAVNHFGADLVLFECHFNTYNDYEIAVRPEGGTFTNFVTYDASEFEETDSVCYDPITNWGLAIDLSDFAEFGITPGTVVDAIQFKVVDPDPGDPNVQAEGEPSMVAVLTSSSGQIHLPLVIHP